MPKFKIQLMLKKIERQFSDYFEIEASTRRAALMKANKIADDIIKPSREPHPDKPLILWQLNLDDDADIHPYIELECETAYIEEIKD